MQAEPLCPPSPGALTFWPLESDPVGASLEGPFHDQQEQEPWPQLVGHQDDEVAARGPLSLESFEYPFDEDGDDFNFDAAFESIFRDTGVVQQAEGQIATTAPHEIQALSTFSWAQDSISLQSCVNPRYLSSIKHTRVESEIISPRTLKRPRLPSPITTGATMVPAIQSATSMLRGDAAPFTPRWSLVWEAPGTPGAVPEHRRDSVEATESYAHRRGHSAAAVELIQGRLRHRDERRKAGLSASHEHWVGDDKSVLLNGSWSFMHRKSRSTPSRLSNTY